jgi:hypothetical protein
VNAAQVVFLTLFLGLIAGRQPVELQVGEAVKLLRVFVDGQSAATLTAPPWRATVNLGANLQPRELLAIGYGNDGDEVGRASQVINLPRPLAEFTIGLQTSNSGAPASIALRWEHVLAAKPSRATISVDGTPLEVDAQFHAKLPPLDMTHPHLIAAEMRFDDGFVARREMVAGGAVSDSIDSELTPVVLTGKLARDAAHRSSLDGCLSVNGAPVQARGPETPEALVLVVREPNVGELLSGLDPGLHSGRTWSESLQIRRTNSLDTGTTMRYVWPIAQHYDAAGHVPSAIFVSSANVKASDAGMLWFLTRAYDAAVLDPNEHRRFADAVAVAGINAITGAHRRAVVLVLSRSADESTVKPAAVRHYLRSVGVPLFVWSLTGPRPDLAASWGNVDDISGPGRFHVAVERLRAALASQHVAWIAGDPISALRVEADPRCGLTPLAQLGR